MKILHAFLVASPLLVLACSGAPDATEHASTESAATIATRDALTSDEATAVAAGAAVTPIIGYAAAVGAVRAELDQLSQTSKWDLWKKPSHIVPVITPSADDQAFLAKWDKLQAQHKALIGSEYQVQRLVGKYPVNGPEAAEQAGEAMLDVP